MYPKVTVLLVGINGYGTIYVKELLKHPKVNLIGIVEIEPTESPIYNEIKKRSIPLYKTMQEFYNNNQSDLAIISTPIHLHKEQSCYAMNCGSNVLCEKPMTSNPEDIQEMINVRNRTGKFLAIGFDWSFTSSIQQLKKDILRGKFGLPKRVKSLVLWPKEKDYYNRSFWAGKKYSPNGKMVFDSVANNAGAHYLHNLLYLLGSTVAESVQIKELTAELYRTNEIETFDTCAVKIKTVSDVSIYYYASHAVHTKRDPIFELAFEKANIQYDLDSNKEIFVTWEDGLQEVYEKPDSDWFAKLNICIKAILEGNTDILCGPEAASAHVRSVRAMHESVPNIPDFHDQNIKFKSHNNSALVEDLNYILETSYEKWCMPNELDNTDWSISGKTVYMN